jgi:hypothetical protein
MYMTRIYTRSRRILLIRENRSAGNSCLRLNAAELRIDRDVPVRAKGRRIHIAFVAEDVVALEILGAEAAHADPVALERVYRRLSVCTRRYEHGVIRRFNLSAMEAPFYPTIISRNSLA